jgi:hypothetical protein
MRFVVRNCLAAAADVACMCLFPYPAFLRHHLTPLAWVAASSFFFFCYLLVLS